MMFRQLGALPKKIDPRTLCAFDILDLTMPRAPLDVSWSSKASGTIPKFKNDTEPNCVAASLAHTLRVQSAAAGQQIVVSDAEVMDFYRQIEQPGGGAYCLDGAKLAVRKGLGGHKLLGFWEIPMDHPRADLATLAGVEICGAVWGGWDLPLTAQDQAVWDMPKGGPTGPGARRSWGGHAMGITSVDAFLRRVQTWGYTQRMTSGFDRYYGSERYLIIWEAAIVGGRTLTGLDLDKALEQVRAVTA
jgi:hypothetical protein